MTIHRMYYVPYSCRCKRFYRTDSRNFEEAFKILQKECQYKVISRVYDHPVRMSVLERIKVERFQ